MKGKKKHSFFERNGLSLVLLIFFVCFLLLQMYTGWWTYNAELRELGKSTIGMGAYLKSAHFLEATAENWESEFLQMAIYVLLTIWLRQLGSSESKPLTGRDTVDRDPRRRFNAPWPVKKGGWILRIYQNSLSLAFILLFLFSFAIHFYASLELHNEEQLARDQIPEKAARYFVSVKFWFESLQNWQSEFLAVLSIVFLSVYLRQKGSPESKPVDSPHHSNK